jgi:hypothetical protein
MTELKSIELITADSLLTVTGGRSQPAPAFGTNPGPGTRTTNGWTVAAAGKLGGFLPGFGTADKKGNQDFGQFQAADEHAKTTFIPMGNNEVD